MRKIAAVLAFACLIPPLSAASQEQEGSLTLFARDGFRFGAGAVAGLQDVAQHNAFWNLGETFAPDESFDAGPVWGETYLKPYLTFGVDLGGVEMYGKFSIIASANLGTDVFDVRNASAVEVEDAFFGLRTGTFDISLGAQPFRLGTGMLLADGGGDGFERGALIFGPRLAWEMTAIGRLTLGPTRAEAFHLDPRELESGDTGTKIAGLSLTHEVAPERSFGIAAGGVLKSDAPWVRAAPGGAGAPVFVPKGRDGMRFLTGWGSWAINERLGLAADFAIQDNDAEDMTAWAARVQVSYAFPQARFQPRIGYTFQTFSGDDPDTTALERFDPLFYDGSPAAWGSGANASLVFLNANISAHQLWSAASITPRDLVTFRYYHVRANELLSPLQFGQGTRLDPAGSPTLISGVTDRHLSDDVYLEYTRILSESAYLTGGLGVSAPGRGIRDLRGGARDVWTGGFVNLVVQF